MPRRWRLYRAAEPQRGIRVAALLVVIFVGLVLVTRLFCTDRLGNSSFWPANGALLVAILVLPPRLGFWTCILCFCANVALNATCAIGLYASVLYSLLNIGMAYLAAFLTRSFGGATTDLSRGRRLMVFAGISLVSAAVEAFFGNFLDPWSTDDGGMLQNWFQWTLCDGLGLLLGTPAILFAIRRRQAHQGGDAKALERWLLLSGTFVLCVLAFSWARNPLLLLLYPALILTAFRAGPAWVLASVLLICIVSSGMTGHGFGPLAMLSANGRDMREDMMQPYLISIFLAAVPANNALGEKKRNAQRLGRLKAAREHEATHDPLTKLANRDLFRRRLPSMLKAGTVRAVLFIDLDRFKHVNDTIGHQAGDELLRLFSARLSAAAPAEALVARFGGDEFAILLTKATAETQIEPLCQAIELAACTPFDLKQGQAHVSASLGVALVTAESNEAGELMRRADISLYAAKAAGRSCTRVFGRELDMQIQEKAALEADLRAALNGTAGLSVNYQLKVDRQGVTSGVEALLRWRHPVHGPIAPPRFIAVAEETGLIVPLGAWVFREAVAFAARWPTLHVAINVSPIQLRHPELVTEMLHTLHECGVAADRIEIEVTETVFVNEAGPAMKNLRLLREAGVCVAIDDFGTGYSSMRQLQRFKVDRLKIDQSFISSLGQGTEPAAIVHAIISLGHAMALQVTAEGVETPQQRDFLVEAGVDEMQGYLFARPTDEAALALTLPRAVARRGEHAVLRVDAREAEVLIS